MMAKMPLSEIGHLEKQIQTLVKFNMAYERKIVNKSLSSMELQAYYKQNVVEMVRRGNMIYAH